MYIPSSFLQTDQNTLHDFLDEYSFAALVTHHDGEAMASHLPLLLERNAGSHGQLLGHMAKANPQWRHTDGGQVLTIFAGPHAYISPTWYEAENVVPTWNYVAVHVYGTLRLVEDRPTLLDIIRRYVDVYEKPMPNPWSLDQTEPGFVDRLLDAIVGFQIDIERLEGKWKLNQNHDRHRRDKVIAALKAGGGEDQHLIADLMSEA